MGGGWGTIPVIETWGEGGGQSFLLRHGEGGRTFPVNETQRLGGPFLLLRHGGGEQSLI